MWPPTNNPANPRVGVGRIRASARATTAPADWRDGLDQGHELGDVVAVAAGQRYCQQHTVRLGVHAMLRARPGAVNWARAGIGPLFIARTCELPVTALNQSSAPAAFSSASSPSCSCC